MQSSPQPPGGTYDVGIALVSLRVGGTEGHVSEITRGLVRRGKRVAVYCLAEKGPLAPQLEAEGVDVFGPPQPYEPGLDRATLIARRARSLMHLRALLAAHRPRILHCMMPEAVVFGAIAGRAAGVRDIVASRRCLNNYQKRRPRAAALERWLMREMVAVLANSRRVLDQVSHERAVAPDRLGLIYNGVDTERFRPDPTRQPVLRRSLGIAADATVIACVANLIPYKGHADLLNGLALVRDRLPAQWALLLVGRDDGIGADLRRLADDLGLGAHVHVLGERKDVPAVLQMADAGVLVSHEEGFSNSVLESMASGLPMLVTDVGGNAEAVLHGHNGLVVPARRPDAIARALSALICAGTEPRATYARNSRERAVRHFSLDVCIGHYEKFYDSVLRQQADVPLSDAAGVGRNAPAAV